MYNERSHVPLVAALGECEALRAQVALRVVLVPAAGRHAITSAQITEEAVGAAHSRLHKAVKRVTGEQEGGAEAIRN